MPEELILYAMSKRFHPNRSAQQAYRPEAGIDCAVPSKTPAARQFGAPQGFHGRIPNPKGGPLGSDTGHITRQNLRLTLL